MRFANIKRLFALAVLSGMTFAVYADDAPVYEVDNYPPPFDSQVMDQAPPPPPARSAMVESSGGLIPEITTPPVSAFPEPPQREAYVPESAPAPLPRPMSSDQRLQKLEQQIKNVQQSGASSKIDELQKEIQGLRAQVEDMTHKLQQAETQQKVMKPAVPSVAREENPDDAVPAKPAKAAVVKKPVAAEVIKKAAPIQSVDPAEEQRIYQTAYDLIKAKRYNDAIATLQKMLQKYPTGQTAANAHYWLGELYGLVNKTEQSTNEFSTVVKKYPSSPKAADAQLRLGLIYLGQLKWADAKVIFKSLVSEHPGTANARLASEQLKQMKRAGH